LEEATVYKTYVISSETEAKMFQKLDELEQKEGELPSFVQLYRQLLRLQSEVRSRFTAPKPNLGQDVFSDRLSQGVPLLPFEFDIQAGEDGYSSSAETDTNERGEEGLS